MITIGYHLIFFQCLLAIRWLFLQQGTLQSWNASYSSNRSTCSFRFLQLGKVASKKVLTKNASSLAVLNKDGTPDTGDNSVLSDECNGAVKPFFFLNNQIDWWTITKYVFNIFFFQVNALIIVWVMIPAVASKATNWRRMERTVRVRKLMDSSTGSHF